MNSKIKVLRNRIQKIEEDVLKLADNIEIKDDDVIVLQEAAADLLFTVTALEY